MFVKRVIAREGDTVRIVDGRVYVNDAAARRLRAGRVQATTLGTAGHPAGLLLRHGRPSTTAGQPAGPCESIVGKVKVRVVALRKRILNNSTLNAELKGFSILGRLCSWRSLPLEFPDPHHGNGRTSPSAPFPEGRHHRQLGAALAGSRFACRTARGSPKNASGKP
jgi:hypothetical protein